MVSDSPSCVERDDSVGASVTLSVEDSVALDCAGNLFAPLDGWCLCAPLDSVPCDVWKRKQVIVVAT